MLSDNLVAFVALDALGADVPCHHIPVGVEHKNGIVADAFHQQPEALLALS
jgi:hypothetical protein